jgi:cation/acetate symporter
MYLMAQIVGAGTLIEVLFDISYLWAVVIVTILMVIYVAIGGMFATTWVQITKAILLLAGVSVLALLTLASFDFSFSAMYAQAQGNHGTDGLLTKGGGLGLSTISAISLGIGLCLGLAGSPHLLMRFFTVKDKAAARVSAGVALGCISYVNTLIFFVIGIGSVALVKGNSAYLDASGGVIGGDNMVAVHLANAVGGEVFLGIIAAVAFATILAVVAGLMLASVTALTHDIYSNVIKTGEIDQSRQVKLSKIAARLQWPKTPVLYFQVRAAVALPNAPTWNRTILSTTKYRPATRVIFVPLVFHGLQTDQISTVPHPMDLRYYLAPIEPR